MNEMSSFNALKKWVEKRIRSYQVEIANCRYLERMRFTQEKTARIEELSAVLDWLRENEKEEKPEVA